MKGFNIKKVIANNKYKTISTIKSLENVKKIPWSIDVSNGKTKVKVNKASN